MPTGPTQNYSEAASRTWRPRPVLARAVRTTAVLGPLVFALVVGAAAARWAPAERLGVSTAVWLVLVVALSSAIMVVANRWLRRLLPLSSMLRLSLVLPDHVPSRFAVARRRWSPDELEHGTGPGGAQQLLALISALAAHDAPTRAHGERVQAYAALIGRELGLSGEDVDRLSWVALLHDVGKVHVPTEVINAKGRPSEEGWARLQAHPDHGGALVEPLRTWLGSWVDGVAQHHERWDGQGYPRGLAGAGISLAARVIAVADTYDVITSARSYKKPMSAEQARAEITRCAGTQFDPDVVRAFLSVGLGRLRLVAGPATLLAALPWVGSLPAQAVSTVSAAAQTAGGQVATVLLATGVGVGSSVTATQAVADVLPTSVATSSPTPARTSAPLTGPTRTPHSGTQHPLTAQPTVGRAPSASSGPVAPPALTPPSPSSAPPSPAGTVTTTGPVEPPTAGPTGAATPSAPGESGTGARPGREARAEPGAARPAPAEPEPAKPAPVPAPAKPAPVPAPAKPAPVPAPAKPAPVPAPAKPAPVPAPAKPAPAKPAPVPAPAKPAPVPAPAKPAPAKPAPVPAPAKPAPVPAPAKPAPAGPAPAKPAPADRGAEEVAPVRPAPARPAPGTT